ncbi:peptidoglycan-binding domain-containing protein [Kitasatospora purpeofusca]|uniref:peptidoglycan-binding domain-containing protein n=1 Tax=Kitasatospora purpeofusca TaxID=67352 RepID=UPI002A59A5AC|nr:peptidoglycan-binding domain-containing protein [Kitasatospora purpeofusca]MDY0813026.1 peptidoglycan-binding domain-containing protein [Kitasatospora purpeofusca]
MPMFPVIKRAAVVTATAALAVTALAGTASARSSVGEIAYGDRGTGVKCVQLALNASLHAGLQTDGIWGARTETAVRQFQYASHLEVDGIVGVQTGSQLLEVIVHNEHDWGTTCWENLPTW